ncbi:uncharacterized protein si:ch73-347e22.8 [Myxocyprinus asiaticus]|uniref:uncharacterized protein si:ch73-347e22.8 n=1 Tax=Myxocyprinus asiaticus TaxID=70543 RepID=UPI002221E745|nr:uncharacterized protein si:ch73-347e22.8 [Myxocyprinus asiaticus]XP_051519554.1 uncharacterized protein si:ch73-347e22.8 [Myxocyprinus asiaticus]
MDKRSCWFAFLCLLLAVNISLVGYMHFRKELTRKLENKMELTNMEIKEKESSIIHFESALENSKKLMSTTETEVTDLQDEIKKSAIDQENKAKQVKDCQNSVENLRTENGIKEKEETDNHDNYAALQAKWSETINGLKQQLNERSQLCEHVKNATEVREHCPPIKTS